MPRKILAIHTLIGSLALTAPGSSGDAYAQTKACGSRDHVVKLLEKKCSELQTALGLVSSKGIMELFTSVSGSWTMVFTDVRGVACVVAAGEAWQQVPLVSLDPEA